MAKPKRKALEDVVLVVKLVRAIRRSVQDLVAEIKPYRV
jgi:hypothetical protein